MYRPAAFVLLALAASVTAPSSPSAAPQVREVNARDEFTVREAMVPMRDGVQLYTLILAPKDAREPRPILLERTPYDATGVLRHSSTRLDVTLGPRMIDRKFIFVTQDLRGRFKSEGTYAMYRVPRGAFNTSGTDETTDAWDTIDWLVKNVEGNNGKVGVWGTSYPGWLTLAALREPHPALVATVPFNPVVDVWKADDWFHWGAFRAAYSFDFIYAMETRKGQNVSYPYEVRDIYSWLLAQGAAGTGLGRRLDARHEMWTRLVENPAYGPYWKDCAADRWFDAPPRIVPTLVVHGFWDQEDIYGAPAVYSALEQHDTANDRVFLAAGPWYHGGHWADGSRLGAITFDEDTALRFRQNVLEPFLDRFLGGANVKAPAPVTAFESGVNRWRQYDRWPQDTTPRRLFLQPAGRLSFDAPSAAESSTAYISDPSKPVPNSPRPHWGYAYDVPVTIDAWRRWLVEDQRFVDGRPDVLTWTSAPLTTPLGVRGPVTVKLFAETTGTDADWVVKLIDVYPDEDVSLQSMSGYELMISADIFRGRYRESLETPHALAPNQVLEYSLMLPHVSHTILPRHRLMVQVQSTWFPLYDRNPQTFVPSIMTAPPEAYVTQTHRVHHDRVHGTYVEVQTGR